MEAQEPKNQRIKKRPPELSPKGEKKVKFSLLTSKEYIPVKKFTN